MRFLTENGLDFTAFPSLLRLEVEVVSMVLAHLRAPLGAVGSFTSGGTESIFLACKSARDYARATKARALPGVFFSAASCPLSRHFVQKG